MQPYVVSKITDADGQLVEEIQPTVKRWVLSEETSAVVRELMEGGVQTGTGKNALVPGLPRGWQIGDQPKARQRRFRGADCGSVNRSLIVPYLANSNNFNRFELLIRALSFFPHGDYGAVTLLCYEGNVVRLYSFV